jgi:hypothetical protein
MGSEFKTGEGVITFKVECNEVERRKLELWWGEVGRRNEFGILATSEEGERSWEYTHQLPRSERTYFFFATVVDLNLPGSVRGEWAAISSPVWITRDFQPADFWNKGGGRQDFSYPNPLNPESYIPIPIKIKGKRQNVKCKIYNILGQLVREIKISNLKSQISKSIYWDGRDSRGLEVPSGIYFYEIGEKKVRRMVVLR